MNKSELAFNVASQIATDFKAGIKPLFGRSLRSEVKIRVSKATNGVDHGLRKAAADFAEEIVRGERLGLIINN